MKIVEVLVDSQKAEYKETEALPMSFAIKTDKFLEVIGTDGMKIDNAANQLLFPGSLTNQQIFDGIEEAVDTSIRVNGSTLFRGTARHRDTVRNPSGKAGYAMELVGGVKDIFQTLRGKTLRGLDIGDSEFSQSNIEASWGGSYDSGFKAVWAPVYYGEPSDTNNGFLPIDMRPHVYFASILDAVWETLGVRVESNLFDTTFFKKFVHVFGVGDDWGVAGSDGKELKTLQSGVFTFGPAPTFANVDFPNEAIDADNIWSTNIGNVDAGVWNFSIRINGVQNATVKFVVQGVHSQNITVFNQDIFIGPITVPSATTFFVEANVVDISTSGSVVQSILTASKFAGPTLGTSVQLESALPSEKVIDFLAGISHLFNLVWYYNPITKTLVVDPRLDFVIDGTRYEGFYKRLKTGSDIDDWSDKFDNESYNLSPPPRPFGDWLILANKPEESEWYEWVKGQGSRNGIPLMGSKYTFNDTGKDGKEVLNPYFEDLLLMKSGSAGFNDNSFMPVILPEADEGGAWPPVPTHESTGPKYAFYLGDVTGYADWKWNGSVRASRPAMYQKPPPITHASITTSSSHGDFIDSSGIRIPGLSSIFRQQWFSILNRGKFLEGEIRLSYDEAIPSSSLFQILKQIQLGQNTYSLIFLGVERYHVLKDDSSKVQFIQLVQIKSDDVARLTSSTQGHTLVPNQP